MRVYASLTHTNLALFDLPATKYEQTTSYVERIFRQLLIFDQQPDDDFDAVLREAALTAKLRDPGFKVTISDTFEQYVLRNRHHAKWEKVRKDYGAYIEWETNRRIKENPYEVATIMELKSWDKVPDFSRQKRNRPFQFDRLYRDAQNLAGQMHELSKDYQQLKDKDLLRIKVNSILVPSKIIFALSGNDSSEFSEDQIAVVDLKLAMDAYSQAHLYLNRLIESLHKVRWSAQGRAAEILDQSLLSANLLAEKLKSRIIETERNFMLYLDADFEQE